VRCSAAAAAVAEAAIRGVKSFGKAKWCAMGGWGFFPSSHVSGGRHVLVLERVMSRES